MSDAQPGGKPAEQLKGANDASRPQQPDKYSRPTVPRVEDFGDVVKNDDQDASLEDLVQFLKKTPPPPSNYMSIPDDFSGSSEEDKWDKLKTKVFRRPSKTRKKPPPRIMLPDSAVAATTIGGYRYIAISIPTERSALAPISALRCPVDDRLEAAFHRDVNSRFGMWKALPASRVVTVLNPVPEDRRESMSSGSLPSIASDRPEQATALSDPAMRKRPHTVSLSPGKEKRYAPGKPRGLAKSRSVRNTHPASQISDLTGIPQSSEEPHTSKAITSEKNEPGPSSRGSHIKTAPTGIDQANEEYG
ncbi:hypothetical protein NUW58_g7303 [Xylaria curta]|uniref:Uncharacterized protein n=1 Tax=Xylaria curta TaxID=42375 RepID=A0ACC1NJ17_9PEZI|nr:hypothetical protein NUW58_g7303 [Xylaria curta]